MYEIAMYFIIYSFIGWIIEIIFHAVTKGKIVNRGFLNGPVCPVYGFGMIAVLLIYNLIGNDSIPVIFIEGVLLTTLIELFAGFILDKFFHARWWDYSKVPFNLNGYICLKFSLIWGFAVVFAIKLVHSSFSKFISIIPKNFGWIFIVFMGIVYLTDTVITVMALIGFNKKISELEKIQHRLKTISDQLTEDIGNKALSTTQTIEYSMVQYELGKAELEDEIEELNRKMEEKINNILHSRHYGVGRLLSTFPTANFHHRNELIKEIIKKFDLKKYS